MLPFPCFFFFFKQNNKRSLSRLYSPSNSSFTAYFAHNYWWKSVRGSLISNKWHHPLIGLSISWLVLFYCKHNYSDSSHLPGQTWRTPMRTNPNSSCLISTAKISGKSHQCLTGLLLKTTDNLEFQNWTNLPLKPARCTIVPLPTRRVDTTNLHVWELSSTPGFTEDMDTAL